MLLFVEISKNSTHCYNACMISEHMTKNKLGILLLIGVVALVLAWFLRRSNSVVAPASPGIPTEVVLKGKNTCLPHKDTNGPQTLECALGMQSDTGVFYALDTSALPFEEAMKIQGSNKPLVVTGQLVPIEAISTNVWQKYDIQGIVHVTKMTVE